MRRAGFWLPYRARAVRHGELHAPKAAAGVAPGASPKLLGPGRHREETTVKYLLIIHNNPALLESLSPAELDAMVGAHEPFQAALRETGELVGFAALTDPSQARVVRRPGGSVPVVTDGPFLEAKEHLAGFYVVDCDTPERAAELAAMMPEAAYGGVEVRAVMEEAGLEM
jgi:hypothetical protein